MPYVLDPKTGKTVWEGEEYNYPVDPYGNGGETRPTTPTPAAPTQTPEDRYVGDLDKAKGIADDMLNGVQPAHISNPRQQENDDYLALLKSRLGGLDSKEMLAAKEQGIADLNAKTAQNLERYASIAGGQGIRGGASAALQRRALNEDNQTRAGLERQLVLDNIAVKDRAMQAYGGALDTATNRDLGIVQYNADADDRMTGLRLNLPFSILSGIGGYRAEDAAAKSNAEQVQLAKDYIKSLETQSTTSNSSTGEPGRNEIAANDQVSLDKITTQINSFLNDFKKAQRTGDWRAFEQATGYTGYGRTGSNGITQLPPAIESAIREQIELQYPDEPETVKAEKVRARIARIKELSFM